MKIFKLKKYLPFFMMLTVFSAVGCSGGETTGQQAMQMPPALVQVHAVEQKDIPYSVRYIAHTEGSKAVDVRPQVSGILKEKKYIEGQFVEAGDVMFVIEPETYKAVLGQAQGSLAQAEANVKQSKLNFDRAQNLYKQNAMSKKDYDAAQAAYDTAKGQLEVAKSAVDNAKIQLGYTSVVAPVSGYSSKSNFSEGNLISSASVQPLTVINQVDPMYVNFSVPSSTMSFLRTLAAQKKLRTDELTVNLFLEDGSPYGEVGKVTFFDKQVSSATGDIKVRAEFSNANLIILPGQFVTAELQGFTLVGAIMIPQKALLKMGTKTMAIVVDESNTAHYREVKTVAIIGNDALIADGLKAGDRVVIEGQNKVAEGAAVQIAPQQATGQQAQ
ncbi:MAG: efflux RND transporter periplasmic adaptor subunit [Deferribacterales bacterium]|nr:efflux RND transporter periplasmic adaptor subunit [Deferribacterales bacterium]